MSLLITAAVAVSPVVAGTSTATAAPLAAPAASASALTVASTKAKALSPLKVIVKGVPQGSVRVKGSHRVYSLTRSTVVRVPVGRYRVRAAGVTIGADNFVPQSRKWTVTVRKGWTTKVTVKYSHVSSAAPGSLSTDTPPAGMLTELFALVNQVRSEPQTCGTKSMPAVDPVTYDAELGKAAQGHAEDMDAQNYFEHDSLDGRSFVDRIEATNYSGQAAGENIAMGHQSAQDVVDGWMASPGHCLNMMDPEFDEMGLGFASHTDARYSVPVTYWVQDFGYAA